MWHPEPINELNPSGKWLVHDRRTDGYLSSNSNSGGALHFPDEAAAFEVAEVLNRHQIA